MTPYCEARRPTMARGEKETLVGHLRELHLPAFRRGYGDGLGYERYLLQLAERECEERRANRIGNGLGPLSDEPQGVPGNSRRLVLVSCSSAGACVVLIPGWACLACSS